MMKDSFLLFALEDQWFAMDVSLVERVLPAAHLTSLFDAPPFIKGLLNVSGEILLVLDMHMLFGVSSKELDPSQRFILSQNRGRSLALLVDRVDDVVKLPLQSLEVPVTSLGDTKETAVATRDDQILRITHLESFLDPYIAQLEGGI